MKNSLIIRRGSKFLSYQNTTKNFLKNPKNIFFGHITIEYIYIIFYRNVLTTLALNSDLPTFVIIPSLAKKVQSKHFLYWILGISDKSPHKEMKKIVKTFYGWLRFNLWHYLAIILTRFSELNLVLCTKKNKFYFYYWPIRNFRMISKFWSKINNLAKNHYFGQKSIIWPKVKNLANNLFWAQILYKIPIGTKIGAITKILIHNLFFKIRTPTI